MADIMFKARASDSKSILPTVARVMEIGNSAGLVPNLVIAGPGLFPTSAGVNPTFTVHALAARSAERLLTNWQQVAE